MAMFRQSGQHHVLVVERDGKKITVDVAARDLL